MRLLLYCLTISIGLISCKKDKPDLDVESFRKCHKSQNLNSSDIEVKLVGSWIWAKQSCFWSGKTELAGRSVKSTFKSDYTFSVIEDSTTLSQGTWKLSPVDDNLWELDLTDPSDFLYGYILFCDDQVLFNSSYRDGCDNLFIKVK